MKEKVGPGRSVAGHRRLSGAAALLGWLWAAGPCGCSIEGEPLLEADRQEPRLLSVEPAPEAEDVPLNVRPRLVFEEYLEPGLLADPPQGILRLSSGDHVLPSSHRHDLVRRSLELIPAEPLRPDLRYRVTLLPQQRIRDLNGNVRMSPLPELVFSTGREPGTAPLPDSSEAEVVERVGELLSGRCAGCHGAARKYAALPDLRRPATIVDRAAVTRAARTLVLPGRPAESYLLHKLLPGYPDRGGEPMPLDAPPLSEAELDLLVRAVQLGWPLE